MFRILVLQILSKVYKFQKKKEPKRNQVVKIHLYLANKKKDNCHTLTRRIAKESETVTSPSTNTGTYLSGFNFSNSTST